jgi:hypothetical protein
MREPVKVQILDMEQHGRKPMPRIAPLYRSPSHAEQEPLSRMNTTDAARLTNQHLKKPNKDAIRQYLSVKADNNFTTSAGLKNYLSILFFGICSSFLALLTTAIIVYSHID